MLNNNEALILCLLCGTTCVLLYNTYRAWFIEKQRECRDFLYHVCYDSKSRALRISLIVYLIVAAPFVITERLSLYMYLLNSIGVAYGSSAYFKYMLREVYYESTLGGNNVLYESSDKALLKEDHVYITLHPGQVGRGKNVGNYAILSKKVVDSSEPHPKDPTTGIFRFVCSNNNVSIYKAFVMLAKNSNNIVFFVVNNSGTFSQVIERWKLLL